MLWYEIVLLILAVLSCIWQFGTFVILKNELS